MALGDGGTRNMALFVQFQTCVGENFFYNPIVVVPRREIGFQIKMGESVRGTFNSHCYCGGYLVIII